MIVYYRLTEIKSTNPSPVYYHDKLKLNELCLKSFVNAFSDINPKVVFICDFCTDKTREMIETLCPFEKEIHFTNLEINGTALQQFFWAYYQEEDIYYAECDYIYNGIIGKKIEKAIKELGIVSPYNHPDHYTKKYSDTFRIKLIDGDHYRSAKNNTMTWGIRNDIYKETYEIWRKWGYLDDKNWEEVREKGFTLWVPIPSFASHMCTDYMAPGISWDKEWNKYL